MWFSKKNKQNDFTSFFQTLEEIVKDYTNKEKKETPKKIISIDYGDLYVDLKYSGQVILIADDYVLLEYDGEKNENLKHLKLVAKKNTPEYERLMGIFNFATQTIRDQEIRSELRGRTMLQDLKDMKKNQIKDEE